MQALYPCGLGPVYLPYARNFRGILHSPRHVEVLPKVDNIHQNTSRSAVHLFMGSL